MDVRLGSMRLGLADAADLRLRRATRWLDGFRLPSKHLFCFAVAVSFGISTLLSTPAQARVATRESSPVCSEGFDAYQYTQAQLAPCSNIKTYPLSRVVPVSGGGEDYQYDLPGGEIANQFSVPTGFNLTNASDSQLESYGIAPRPTASAGPSVLLAWMEALPEIKFPTPTAFIAETDSSSPPPSVTSASSQRAGGSQASGTSDFNWGGYVLCENSSNTYGSCNDGVFSQAEGEYNEPSYNNNNCTGQSVNGTSVPSTDSNWAGIGGMNGTTLLAQDGTAHGVGGIPNHGAWWETWPDNNMSPFPGEISANVGDNVLALVEHTGSGSGSDYYFEVRDEATNQVVTESVYDAPYSGESAEVVTERTSQSIGGKNYYTALSDFSGEPITTNAYANNVGFATYPATDARWGVNMTERSTGATLSTTSSISGGDQFEEAWKGCGSVEPAP